MIQITDAIFHRCTFDIVWDVGCTFDVVRDVGCAVVVVSPLFIALIFEVIIIITTNVSSIVAISGATAYNDYVVIFAVFSLVVGFATIVGSRRLHVSVVVAEKVDVQVFDGCSLIKMRGSFGRS